MVLVCTWVFVTGVGRGGVKVGLGWCVYFQEMVASISCDLSCHGWHFGESISSS